jgi:hypothetical protein
MAILDAATATQHWQNSAGAAQTAYTQGVQNTTVDVIGRAVAQAQKALNGYTSAITSGLWARRLTDVGTTGWKSAAVAKAANYGVGIQASGGKYQAAYSAMLPTMQALQAQIDAMPNVTLADSIARATTWIQGMHNYRLTKA